MVQFKDLKSKAGLTELNHHLESRSFIDGWQPSESDVSTFEAITTAPSSDLPHALRWYNHIKSFAKDERTKWSKAASGCQASSSAGKTNGGAAKAAAAADEDEDVDLFGDSDKEEDDEEKERIKEERLKAYAEKKGKKPGVIAKSTIVLDVKPWDDETDLKEMEKLIRQIQADGLVWGASKLIPVAYGIQKLQIGCVVEDDKVGMDFLEDNITALEDFVQSIDVAAFQKI